MSKEAESISINLREVMSAPNDMSSALARIGSRVLVKCDQSFQEGIIVAIKSPKLAIVVFNDDLQEEKHEVEQERITLMRGD